MVVKVPLLGLLQIDWRDSLSWPSFLQDKKYIKLSFFLTAND